MDDEQPESTETLGEAFDRWLIEEPLEKLESFIEEAPQLLSSKPLKSLEFLRDCKARVDARLAAEPETKVFSMSHRIRCWAEISERFEAEINWRTTQATQIASVQDKKVLRSGAQKDHTVAARRVVVRQNGDVSDQELCEILDREHIALPRDWQNGDLKGWSDAWRERKSRIQVIFSKDRTSD